MKRSLPIFPALAAVLMSSSFIPLKASESDRRTIITISQPIDVQGTILPAGQYVLRLSDSSSRRDAVYIFNGDETQLVTMIMAFPAERLKTPEKSEFSFYDSPSGEPAALHTWFYPGNESGIEFARSQRTAAAGFNAALASGKGAPARSPKHMAAAANSGAASN
jgi:hypothetical protein